MAKGKKSFNLYTDLIKILDGNNDHDVEIPPMPDEAAGRLFKTILRYVNDLHPKVDYDIAVAFGFVKKELDIQLEAYKAKCKKNKENVEMRWNKEKQKDTNEYERKKEDTNDTDKIRKDKIREDISNNKGFNKLNLPQSDAEPKDKKSFNLELFELFWAAYPLKKEKQNCLKWFKSHKPSKEQVQKMITAIEIQKKSSQWREGYIKYPYTWLNSGSWDDEPEQHVLNQIKPDNRGFEEL